MKRFQECSWLVRLWRRRHYLPIPFWHLHWLLFYYRFQNKESEDYMWPDLHWSILIGMAQSKMKWYYTWEEVKEHLGYGDEDIKADQLK